MGLLGMQRPILVTGGTGTLGRVLVQQLLDKGLQPRILSRRPENSGDPPGVQWVTADLLSGAEVADAVADVDAIVHCATNYARPEDDVHGTRRLIETALRGGSPHLIYVSIVGVDKIPVKMYRYKAGIEGIVQRGGLPWTVQRATQFHDLVAGIIRRASRLPIMPLPTGVRFQPIDTGDLAQRLVNLACGPAVGRADDIGGPRVEGVADLAEQYLRAAGKTRRIASIPLPGKVFRGYRHGDNLAPDHPAGTVTFEQYLARTIKRRPAGG
jgi:uncharacterized protein YbjT (DUF2867 family)